VNASAITMPDDKQGAIHSATDGGVVGKHPEPDRSQLLVAPSTSTEFNTARFRLIPIACFRIEDVRFKFDSSFVLPDIKTEMTAYSELRNLDSRVMDAPISIFGHADPSFQGNFELGASTHQSGDDYNKTLSGRRAIAIYALLIRDPALWDALFSRHLGGDVWGEDSIRIILDQVDPQDPSNNPNQGASDSARDARVRDTANDSGERQQLFLKYMNLVCGDLKLDKSSDFLARGAGPDQKGDVQGCSRFNPLLLFSQEKEAEFKDADHEKDQGILATRNADNASNRRVMILVFRKGSQVLPAKWPCPTFKEGSGGCKKRFFADGDTRRSTHTPGADRKFDDAHDTFACRFYQRISSGSPCGATLNTFKIRLYDPDGKFIKSAPCRVTIAGKVLSSVKQAGPDGFVVLRDLETPSECFVEWGFPPGQDPAQRGKGDTSGDTSLPEESEQQPEDEFPFFLKVLLTIDESSQDKEAADLLNNLGYPVGLPLHVNVFAFQNDFGQEFGLKATGKLDDGKTMAAIRNVHDRCADNLRTGSDAEG
jgi:outer membrane protein OmpA-like peptidoglycan-associated protein